LQKKGVDRGLNGKLGVRLSHTCSEGQNITNQFDKAKGGGEAQGKEEEEEGKEEATKFVLNPSSTAG
jgi:hypothetical protein